MCCFSQPVETVSDTNIFARGADGKQFLVYSMTYAATADLAMVLPLPVPPHPTEDAVRFISLEHYPGFFYDMARGFDPGPYTLSVPDRLLEATAAPPLRVHDVGSFEASFVPRIEDFDRLDERFRISRDVWNTLPVYHDYGFAVFKLKRSREAHGEAPGGRSSERLLTPLRVHPMALEFPRRNEDLLYFPTVHVHDLAVHADAMFDHMLYCQADVQIDHDGGDRTSSSATASAFTDIERLAQAFKPPSIRVARGWEMSFEPISRFMRIKRSEGIVVRDQCWRRSLVGWFENKDTWVRQDGLFEVSSV